MNIISAKNPRWINGKNLVLDVEFEESGWVEFCASPDDPEEHGRDLYTRVISGEFGEVPEYIANVSNIPPVVDIRQAKLALLGAGLLKSVDIAIESIEDEIERETAKIEWEYASEIMRDWPTLLILADKMGLSSQDIDNLFLVAATL